MGFALFSLVSCTKDSAPETPTPPIVDAVDPPTVAVLSIPANNSTCEEGFDLNATESSVSFSWEATANTDSYEIIIINLDTQAQTNKSSISGTSTSVTLQKGIPYSWQIISKSLTTTETATSALWKFYLAGEGIANYAPFPPSPISPASGVTVAPNSEGKLTLSWEGSDTDGDALTYTVFLDTVDGLQTPPEDYQELTTTSLEVAVTANTIYYWRITADDGNNATTSIVYTFRTE